MDGDDATHRALMMLLGAQSKREVLRARFRTTAAMRVQAGEQGRYLGGRPPYGYRLVDAGPHPKAAHARWGRRARRLDPDPVTAPCVSWMFAQRLAGHSVASIARELNEMGVPCPSRVDRDRNRHRSGDGWTLRTVAAILANPRYTGRQVWNRQRTDHDAQEIEGVPGAGPVHRWNTIQQWVISRRPAHPPLVSEEDFVAVQAVNAVPAPRDGASRAYLLTGLLICQLCGRRLDAHWVHGRAGYRCRHGRNSARPSAATCQTRTIYVREDRVLAHVVDQLRVTGEWTDGLADPRKLVAHLWRHHITITCGSTRLEINTSEEPGLIQPALFGL